jgi:hypothetical protein
MLGSAEALLLSNKEWAVGLKVGGVGRGGKGGAWGWGVGGSLEVRKSYARGNTA